ncbi:MAG: DedA family protein [Bacteroidetes bacterium]|jgi:membrane-associated protein|nr:DedA family protein [Bacteroidota bacterium]
MLHQILDFFLHLDKYLGAMINEYGVWIYAILFLIIFVETGLVIMPFLPGDSLLFAAGLFAAQDNILNIWILLILLFAAAVLGDSVNYLIGKYAGQKVLNWKLKGKPLIKPQYMEKTHQFYDKHGAKTIVIARFVPIVRTFAPFVAGIGEMHYNKFITYNIVGGAVWILSLTLAGFFFGNYAWVQHNFEKVIFGIILVSILPILIEIVKSKWKKS